MAHTHTFKLLDSIVCDNKTNANNKDCDTDSDDSNNNDKTKEFIVQLFGINTLGEDVCIFVKGFTPYLYLKVGDNWGGEQKRSFYTYVANKCGGKERCGITSFQLISRKKLYGFDAGKQHKFIHVKFNDVESKYKVEKIWYQRETDEDGNVKNVLKRGGILYNRCNIEIYESFVLPLLRFFHMKEISPSGWIGVPTDVKPVLQALQKTNCKYEYNIEYKNIIVFKEMEDPVPYNTLSMDIEAGSSHFDFPLPKKNYRKLATNLIDYFEIKANAPYHTKNAHTKITNLITSAFDTTTPNNDIDKVFVKSPISKKDVEEKVKYLMGMYGYMNECDTFEKGNGVQYTKDDGENDVGEDDGGEDDEPTEGKIQDKPLFKIFRDTGTPSSEKHKIISIVDILYTNSAKYNRDQKIAAITILMDSIFPPLEGDPVTFIGGTFTRHGEDKPYLRHCIVLNSCNKLLTENTVIETYDTEKEVLLAWTRLVQRENPDIIIGYNIFGFDYNFMFERAKQCNCECEFLKLSRNKGEICGKYRGGEIDISRSSTKLVGVTYNLSVIQMPGRLQVDMLFWFRRREKYESYQLDNVVAIIIGEVVKKIEPITDNEGGKITRFTAVNVYGLEIGSFVRFEEIRHSSSKYKNGEKFEVTNINSKENWFEINGHETPDAPKVRWGLTKDDVSYKDMFRMTNEGPGPRSIVAKYCIQDCNTVAQIFKKVDVITDICEMSKLCSVPMSFLIFRGQSIKLTSFVAKKCAEKGFLMPDINKGSGDKYEGAIVLEAKNKFYSADEPVAVGDYSSLYPSCMLSENMCPSSKVWSKLFDLNGNFLSVETGVCDKNGNFIYDNLPNYTYVNVEFDVLKNIRKTPKGKLERVAVGRKICRYAKYRDEMAVMPAILSELLKSRKMTRKMIPQQKDEFMKNIYDKRQLAIKETANSVYGQLGAGISTFYEPDVAASTTATGRKLLTYAKRILEECYQKTLVETTQGEMLVTVDYVYGDTDSVFIKFTMIDVKTNTQVVGRKILELTIEVGQIACALVSQFLKPPHDFEYEKTYAPFLLLSKKRYVGKKYGLDANKSSRDGKGVVLTRRDNAPIVKDIYGGVNDILMESTGNPIREACAFVDDLLQKMVDEEIHEDKLIISKSLSAYYKFPTHIAHRVLADRMAARDPGNKPASGDRIPYMFIVKNGTVKLQGEKIETPTFISENKLKIDYGYYITNQIMKPLSQMLGLVLLDIWREQNKHMKIKTFVKKLEEIDTMSGLDDKKKAEKKQKMRDAEIKMLIFDKYLRKIENKKNNVTPLTGYFQKI